MAHLGDPLEDVAWAQLVCWRLGTGLVGGLLSLAEWSAAYGDAAGHEVDAGALRFWEVLGSVKMSLLAWREGQRTPAGREHDLLLRLFSDLQTELGENLLD